MRKEFLLIIPGLLFSLLFLAGCPSHKPVEATEEEQLIALEGGDLPLAQISEDMELSEPMPEDALILKDIHFDFDDSRIKESEKPILEGISTWMINHPVTELLIEGHCDERGTKEYNMALGERRALSVRSHLTGLGINPDRLYTNSYGEEKPICFESDENCWSQNRRSHFLVDYGEEEVSSEMVMSISPEEEIIEIEETTVVVEEVEEPREEIGPLEKTRRRAISRYYY